MIIKKNKIKIALLICWLLQSQRISKKCNLSGGKSIVKMAIYSDDT